MSERPSERPNGPSFWSTTPGCITAVSGLIVALTGLIATLNQVGWIGQNSASPTPTMLIPTPTPPTLTLTSTPHPTSWPIPNDQPQAPTQPPAVLPPTQPPAPPTDAPPTDAPPTPEEEEPPASSTFIITGTGTGGLFLRAAPSASGPVVATLPEGTRVESLGERATAHGRQWVRVRAPQGTGWVVADFLKSVPADAP